MTLPTSERMQWDETYRARAQEPYPAPDPLLFEHTPPLFKREPPAPRALDLACGFGQNGLWLAAQGYTVDLVDYSRVALLRAREEAVARGLREVNFLPVDIATQPLQVGHYALVCVFRFLDRECFTALRAAVQPGGRIIYETFNSRFLALRPDFSPAYLLALGELVGYFADWRLLLVEDDGPISRVVAVKPGEAG